MATPLHPTFYCDPDDGPQDMRMRKYQEYVETKPDPTRRDMFNAPIWRRRITIMILVGDFDAPTVMGDSFTTLHSLGTLERVGPVDVGGSETLEMMVDPYTTAEHGPSIPDGWQLYNIGTDFNDTGVCTITAQFRSEQIFSADV